MTGLLFAAPEWLAPGLAAVATIAGTLLWAGSRSRRDLQRLLGSASRSSALGRPRRLAVVRDLALLLTLLAVLVGILGPRFGRENVQLSTSGVDLVVVLDTSRSMDALDVPPSRLAAARHAALALLAGLGPGDRAALSVFAGRGVLLTPLTSDHAALIEMVTAIETTLVKPGGSNIPAGVIAAISAFEPIDERPRAIFLLTDGESPGHPIEVGLVTAARANVRVFPVAFGTREGATIPDHGVPLRDGQGEIVTSRRRLTSLEAIAHRTGGRLFTTDEWGRFDVEAGLRDLHAPVAAAPGEFVDHPVTVPVVVPFAGLALSLLLLDWLAPAVLGRSRASRRDPHRRALLAPSGRPSLAATLVVCLVSLAATPDPSQDVPTPDADRLLRTGLDHAAHDSWAQARTSFRDAAIAATDPRLRAIAYHDLGVAALRLKDFEGARDAFLDALATTGEKIDPDRVTRTQWNLEWSVQQLAEGASPKLPDSAPKTPEPTDEPTKERAESRKNDEKKEQPREPEKDATAGETPDPGPEERMPRDAERGRHPRASSPLPDSLPELDADQRESWLARIEDDPRRALLSAAFESHDDRRRRKLGGPTW